MPNRVHLGDTMQTTCPHCGSVFRVTTPQLENGHGQVICGLCHQRFNALLSLENYQGETVEILPETVLQTPQTRLEPIIEETARDAATEPVVSLHEAMYGDARKQRTNLKPLLWFVGILLLLIIAIVQVIYYQRYALISSPHYQSQILELCQILPCDPHKFVDTAQIHLLERNIFTHPTRKHALMVTGSFVNQAPFTQSLPRLRISLSDIQGNFIASRLFKPDEYLTDHSVKRLPPGKPVQFRLEIEDPGSSALTYEFEFFP